MKKILVSLLVVFGLLLVRPVQAEPTVEVFVFVSKNCRHCHNLKQALSDYAKTRSWLKPYFLEVSDSNNHQLMRQVADQLQVNSSGVPFTVIGNQSFIGYSSAVDDQIKHKIDSCHQQSCDNLIRQSTDGWSISSQLHQSSNSQSPIEPSTNAPTSVRLPLLGEISVQNLPVPILTILIGLVDGFNPCAMWALIFIISLLIGLKDRRRMWAYGLAFIITSAVVYFFFLLAWVSVFDLIGFARPLQIVIGLLALGIGGYYLREWHRADNVCKVTNLKSRRQFFERLKKSVLAHRFWLGLLGVIILALAVNLVELLCSAGLPAVYTAVLSGLELNTWQYVGYLLLYVLFFMLDDMIVFGIAMKTMKIANADGKYNRISRLVGGILMLVLGCLLIFAPQWLAF